MFSNFNTKEHFVNTFKLLLEKHNLSEITVCLICKKANLTRKIFYNYFKNKQELIIYIFEKEFLSTLNKDCNVNEFFKSSVYYFYNNANVYKKLFFRSEQSDIFQYYYKIISDKINQYFGMYFSPEERSFANALVTNALTHSIAKWLDSKNMLPPKDFIDLTSKVFTLLNK